MKKRTFAFPTQTAPLFLLLVLLLGFGLLLPRLGFYWDDWAKILVSRLWGLRAYFNYYAEDRPLSAWTHILLTPLLGPAPLAWQIFALALRWLSACGMVWSLNGLWPQARRQNLTAALLFAEYPVFVSQPVALTFHQQWLQYALFFLSLGAMIYAARAKGKPAFWGLTALSLAAMLAQLTITEYFAPLELVRPLVLWFLLAEPGKPPASARRAGRTLAAWAPYLALIAAYTAWRLFFFKLPGADPYRANTLYQFIAHPLSTLRETALITLNDLQRILLTAWSDLLRFDVLDAAPFTLLSYALGALAGAATLAYLLFYDRGAAAGDETSPAWARQALALGLLAILLGPVPAWITGRQVVFDFHSDRYAMPAMFGAALLVAALVEWLARRRLQVAMITGLLVMLAVGLHLRVANDYRWIWTDEQRFFWQLAWRAPGLQAPTALFLENEPFPNQGLFSTSAALNLMYPQPAGWGAPAGQNAPAGANRLAYWIYTLRPRYQQAPQNLNIGLTSTFRTLQFNGKAPDNTLLLYKDSTHGNCLWVLSPADADHPYLTDLVRGFLPISNLSRIQAAPAAGYPPSQMIGREPAHTWCYFYEKAALARQMQDWAGVAGLAAQAKARGYTPTTPGANSPYEWLPFIEGLARSGDWKEAARLTRRSFESDAAYLKMLCGLWNRLAPAATGADAAGAVSDTRAALKCPAP